MSHRGIDQTVISRQLVTLAISAIVVLMAFHVLKTNNYMLMAGFLALPFALMLMHAPKFTLVVAVLLNATMLPMPGNIASSTLGLLGYIVLAGTYFLGLAMGKRAWTPEKGIVSKVIRAYLIWLFLLMAIHGAGLRMLGSESWGGTRYIAHLVAVVVFFALSGLRIEKKHIRWILIGSVVTGLIGSLLKWKGYAVGVGDVDSAASEVVQSRLRFVTPFVASLLAFTLAWKFKRLPLLKLVLILACVALIGLTGFRSRLVGTILVIGGYGFFRVKNRGLYVFSSVVLLILFWGLMVAITPSLPLGLQRAVSFLPGTHVTAETAYDAQHSIEWRQEVWGFCLSKAGEYWLLGRGMAFKVWDVVDNVSGGDIMAFSPLFAYETHAYHSGPLALFIDMGLPGTVIFLMFTCIVIKRFWGYAIRLSKIDTLESRFAMYCCVHLLYKFFNFYFVYGDFNSIAWLISTFAAYSVIVKSVLELHAKDDAENAVPA